MNRWASVPFQIRVLGGLAVTDAGGSDRTPPGRKLRALIACMALPPGDAWPRERLTAVFWGDRDQVQARNSLRQGLTKLRRMLGNAALLRTDRDTVAFDCASVSVDALDFVRLARAGELEHAAELYRGHLLDGLDLPDEGFTDWLLVERTRLHDLAVDVLGRLLESQAGETAIGTARRLLQLVPAREETHRSLMKLYTAQGNRAHALRQYQACRDTLERELGVSPEPETKRLFEAILRRATPPPPTVVALPFEPQQSPRSSELSEPSAPSVAVLPFENMSGDLEQQYFSDGITEDIITELSRFHQLLVTAPNSSFVFRSTSIKVQDIARELAVAYVVEGSVRRAADRVRITAQLVDASSGNHLWAERYDRDMRDIFAVQDEIARSVASIVSGRVEAAGRERAVRLSPTALRAYDLILRAKALMSKYTRADNAQALTCAERAVELDPASARAHAQSAWCHFFNYMAFWTADRATALAKAYELAQRAVVLDETDSFARCILGLIHLMRREYDEAGSETEKAIGLNPNDPEARRYYGDFLAATGRAEAAIEQIDLAKRLNPFDTRWVPWVRGIACFTARRYDEAIATLRQAREPINEVRGWLAASYAHAGRLQEARATLGEFLRIAESDIAIFPGRRLKDWEAYWHGAFEYQDQKDFDHLFDALRKAGLPE
jgi:TolB-like protein/Flp pilus assembly protein TadD